MGYKVRSTSNDCKARSEVRKPKHGLQGTLDIKQTIGKPDPGVRKPKHGLQGTLDIKRLESQIRSKKTKTWTTRYARHQTLESQIRSKKTKTWTTRYARHQTIGKPDQE